MQVLALIEQANGRRLTKRQAANAKSVAVALDEYGLQMGLNQPHRLVQYLAQLAHESAGFVHDREIWGPTAAQKRYEGRADLGNTQPGDGKKFAGHGPIQVTGRDNHRQFTTWCKKKFPHLGVPNFEQSPKLINTDPWEGLTGIWYWSTRNLNRYADSGDVEMITKKINGGLNGYQDRIDWLVRFSLVANGYLHNDVRGFQERADLIVDGIAGPKTRALLHKSLVALTQIEDLSGDVKDAPVTQEKPTVPTQIDERVKKQSSWWEKLIGGLSGVGLGGAWIAGTDWQTVAVIGGFGVLGVGGLVIFRKQIINTISDVREAVEK